MQCCYAESRVFLISMPSVIVPTWYLIKKVFSAGVVVLHCLKSYFGILCIDLFPVLYKYFDDRKYQS